MRHELERAAQGSANQGAEQRGRLHVHLKGVFSLLAQCSARVPMASQVWEGSGHLRRGFISGIRPPVSIPCCA
eukprot:scaffold76623_cov69-Phaeocystis_antarctica.AAC.2